MIPSSYLQEWSAHAPWPDSRQIEQDLIICRALCDLFNAPALAGKIAFRGGTAINKLLFKRSLRYSTSIWCHSPTSKQTAMMMSIVIQITRMIMIEMPMMTDLMWSMLIETKMMIEICSKTKTKTCCVNLSGS